MSFFRNRDVTILRALFAAKGNFISRRQLAQAAGVTSNEIERVLNTYVEVGYPIEIHPQRGISLKEPSDIWCAEEIVARCPAQKSGPVWDPLILSKTSSTNDVAREQASRGAKAGFLVAAGRQTKGRGRLGRSWESPSERGLYVSLLLRPSLSIAQAGQLTILSSVANGRCNRSCFVSSAPNQMAQ